MIEWLRHLFGFCGEPHGLIYILLTGSGLSALLFTIKLKFHDKDKYAK